MAISILIENVQNIIKKLKIIATFHLNIYRMLNM